MLRTYLITGTALALSVAASPARADHDRALGFIIGGALLGAAIAHKVNDHAVHSHGHVSTRHYQAAPVYYVSPRHHGRTRNRHSAGHHHHVRHH